MTSLWIGLAGGLGAIARYHLDRWIHVRIDTSFPLGVLVVNALGSFLAAALLAASLREEVVGPTLRLVLVVGFLGGFTTYSAFNQTTLRYLASGAYPTALAHVLATLTGCLAAGGLGWAAGRALTHAS